MTIFIEPAHEFRVRESLTLDQDSIVSQEHALDCDVTVILGRYSRTGLLPPGRGPGVYQDVSALCGADHAGTIDVFKAAQEAVDSARAVEEGLNLKIRDLESKAVAPPVPPVPPVV